MKIQQAATPGDLRDFIRLPYEIYRDDPFWVAPLRSEVKGQFNPKKNPMLEHCDYQLLLLRDGKKTIGRIGALIDHLAVEHWQEKVGLFAYYECPDDPKASEFLLNAAGDWLKARGMTAMRGPWSFVSQEWGAVVEGFQPEPVIMSPYNPPYYNDHFTRLGLKKIKDLLVYYIDAREGYQIPERILTLTDKVAARYGVRVRSIDMRNFEDEVQTFIELSNQSLSDNWGYSPVTDEEAKAMAHDLKSVLHPKAVVFAVDNQDRPIGFAVALPDVNRLLKGLNGRLFPRGILRLLFGLPRLKQYRMFALGVIPEYHGRGIDSLIYRALYESCFSPDLRMEINYILEDNHPMNNAVKKLGAKPLRRYRVYEKTL